MPQRFLRPGITNSSRWNSVSWTAQSLYIRLLTRVDDYGRHDGRVSVIWANCFSVWNDLHPDEIVELQQVVRMLQQLSDAKLIEVYEAEDKKVLQILQWQERIRANVKKWWPDKPDLQQLPAHLQDCAATSTASSPPPSPPPSPIVHVPCGNPHTKRQRFQKPSLEEVKLYAAKSGVSEFEAEKFFNYYESNGWKVGRNLMVSWHGAFANWKSNIQNYGQQANKTHQRSHTRGVDRNAGTANQGRASDYAGAYVKTLSKTNGLQNPQ